LPEAFWSSGGKALMREKLHRQFFKAHNLRAARIRARKSIGVSQGMSLLVEELETRLQSYRRLLHWKVKNMRYIDSVGARLPGCESVA